MDVIAGLKTHSEIPKTLEVVKDGDSYTDTEKETVKHMREHYKWTEVADTWFRTEISKWAATK